MESRSTFVTEPLTISEGAAARWAANLPLNSPAETGSGSVPRSEDVLRNAGAGSDGETGK